MQGLLSTLLDKQPQNYKKAQILKGISCNIPSGTFVGLIGPAGSGKTTLLRGRTIDDTYLF